GLGLGVGHLLRQEALDDRDLLLLLLGELGTIALLVELDRLAALLDQALHHPLDVAFLDAVGIALAARVDVALLERREDHAHGRDAALIARLHRLLECAGEGVAQRHELPPLRSVFESKRKRTLLKPSRNSNSAALS